MKPGNFLYILISSTIAATPTLFHLIYPPYLPLFQRIQSKISSSRSLYYPPQPVFPHIHCLLSSLSTLNNSCAQLEIQLFYVGETSIKLPYWTKLKLTTDHRACAFSFSFGKQDLYFAEGQNMLVLNTCNVLKYTNRSNNTCPSSFFLL